MPNLESRALPQLDKTEQSSEEMVKRPNWRTTNSSVEERRLRVKTTFVKKKRKKRKAWPCAEHRTSLHTLKEKGEALKAEEQSPGRGCSSAGKRCCPEGLLSTTIAAWVAERAEVDRRLARAGYAKDIAETEVLMAEEGIVRAADVCSPRQKQAASRTAAVRAGETRLAAREAEEPGAGRGSEGVA